MSEIEIRTAIPSDATVIAAIYNHYVLNSTATFDTEPGSVDDRLLWLEEHGDEYPVLVAESADGVLGWGSLSRWATRPAWSRTAEVGVYVAHDATGSGVGPALLTALVQAGRRAGLHALIAQIEAGNEPSIKMAQRAGFERVGTLKEVGYKFQSWLDVVLVEKII